MSVETVSIYDAKTDPEFQKPYKDIEEERYRVLPNGEKEKYWYVHGGFEDTAVRFSFCFPFKEKYEGRFFQYLSPVPGPKDELASLAQTGEDDKIAFAITHGAYFVESNMGASAYFDAKLAHSSIYHSNAAVAEYSRIAAASLYGEHRPYGYVYGGSGGGFKSMDCIERTNAFDGAVPYVIGSPVAIPNCFTVRVHALRILRNKLPQIVEALEPGGSGDMYAGLNDEERAALEEVTRFGFPPRSWFAYDAIGDGSLPVLAPGVAMRDPEYFQDFWSKPGYLGADPNSSASRDRIQFRSVVKRVFIPGVSEQIEVDSRNGVDDAWQKLLSDGGGEEKAWIELEEVPAGDNLYLAGINIILESGQAKGRRMLLGAMAGNRLIIGMTFGMNDLPEVLGQIQAGDRVCLDNSDYIAIQSYHRHCVPDKEFTVWDQYRDENGDPLYPQRSATIFKDVASGQSGKIQGKVIVVEALLDESALPWQADWYRRRVAKANRGDETDIFRLWYIDTCFHDFRATTIDNLHLVPYLGALQQALLDLSAWVERGVDPIPTSNYKVEDGQVIVPETAFERGGVQPVVTLLANGSICAYVKAGEEVSFEAAAEVPPLAGTLTKAEWSFEGEQDFPVKGIMKLEEEGTRARIKATHAYAEPGTYYAVVRVQSNRKGNLDDAFTQIKNICRVRVVVSD